MSSKRPGRVPSKRPGIVAANRQIPPIVAEALAALDDAQERLGLYVQSGAVVRLRHDRTGRAITELVTPSLMVWLLAQAAPWTFPQPNGQIRQGPPPLVIAHSVLVVGDWPFPELAGVIETPIIRPDGSILTEPGYDEATGFFYAPPDGLSVPAVPEHPTADDIARGVAILDDAYADFCFADEASRATAIAGLVTAVLRPSIPGRTPLFAFDAPVMGTGKSALAGLISTVATGGYAGTMPEPEDDAEWRKAYTALLREGHALIVLDDVRRRLESPVLAMAVTVERWRDRLLGTNTTGFFLNRTTINVCGNNLALGGDLGRRAVWCRLDTRLAQPYLRDTFRHPDFDAWAREHRGDLLWAVLVSARAWWAAGCPDPQIPALAGFREWRRIVGGILEHAGIHGLLGNLATMRATLDEGTVEFEQFLRAWEGVFKDRPVRIADVAQEIAGGGVLREAVPSRLAEFLDHKGKLSHRLGNLLRWKVDVRHGVDCIRVERGGFDGHANAGTWRVVLDEAQQVSDDAAEPQVVTSPESGAASGATPTDHGLLPFAIDRLAGDGDGRRTYLLDLARELQFPQLPFAAGRTVPAGQPAWTTFATRASTEDVTSAVAALQALAEEAR
ncbi:MAG TPA: hypothetical protein VKZ50_01415 [bacterium]|nr:hypothetical protein [bacterium]